jgi:hypothetical protein
MKAAVGFLGKELTSIDVTSTPLFFALLGRVETPIPVDR